MGKAWRTPFLSTPTEPLRASLICLKQKLPDTEQHSESYIAGRVALFRRKTVPDNESPQSSPEHLTQNWTHISPELKKNH